jgi:uncharacterized hydrophobic protein (TIGR00271 family)
MSLIFHLKALSDADKSKAIEKLITESTPDFDFFLLMTLSILMSTLGLLVDSAAVVIGSMLIAPLLSPVVSISLGVVMSDVKLISRSLTTVLKSVTVGIFAAVVATLFFGTGSESITSEVVSRTSPSLVYFFVALISGFAISYTIVRPELSATLPGAAVAVALVPPLAVIGVGIAELQWSIVSGATMLFLLNIIGILFASMLVFSLMDIYGKKKVAEKTIQKEERRLEKEKEQEQEFKKEENSDTKSKN